jgi:hypothetical protein
MAHKSWIDEFEAYRRRWGLRKAKWIFAKYPTNDRRVIERRGGLLWMIDDLAPTHTFTLQTNLTQWDLGISLSNPEYVLAKMFEKGVSRLAKMDLALNNDLLLEEARYSPFRLNWIAFPEGKDGRLHYHGVMGVHEAVKVRFEGMIEEWRTKFNSDERNCGCSLEIDELRNRPKQLSYPMKGIGDDLLFKNLVMSADFLPKGFPHLVQKGFKYVPAQLDPVPARFPRNWDEERERKQESESPSKATRRTLAKKR